MLLDGAAASQSVKDSPIAWEHLIVSEIVCMEVCAKGLMIENADCNVCTNREV